MLWLLVNFMIGKLLLNKRMTLLQAMAARFLTLFLAQFGRIFGWWQFGYSVIKLVPYLVLYLLHNNRGQKTSFNLIQKLVQYKNPFSASTKCKVRSIWSLQTSTTGDSSWNLKTDPKICQYLVHTPFSRFLFFSILITLILMILLSLFIVGGIPSPGRGIVDKNWSNRSKTTVVRCKRDFPPFVYVCVYQPACV